MNCQGAAEYHKANPYINQSNQCVVYRHGVQSECLTDYQNDWHENHYREQAVTGSDIDIRSSALPVKKGGETPV